MLCRTRIARLRQTERARHREGERDQPSQSFRRVSRVYNRQRQTDRQTDRQKDRKTGTETERDRDGGGRREGGREREMTPGEVAVAVDIIVIDLALQHVFDFLVRLQTRRSVTLTQRTHVTESYKPSDK